MKSEKGLPHDPPKLPKPAEGGLGGFGGCQDAPILKNDPPASDLADDCAGALIDPDGGAYLSRGPYLAADNVRRLRAELFAMVDEQARAEGWTPRRYAETLSRAVDGPR
ncbi:hypothetical protein [Paraburkholderia lycopersici]|uniref:Uncharacterized protein n=1 Tax=Paraburkholderia lycopersici TaxID=416944 RepID=A0A1G6JX97_9BURK|nr:hypothetical protein [Paraburkholderia lycopersici]SDC23343.1 hypothetical protein SAMN05421548_10522 [Paraburkholderia lycopersici]